MSDKNHYSENFPPAVQHQLKDTEQFLNELFEEQTFDIKSPYPTLHGSGITLKRGKRCFEYKDVQVQHGEGFQPVEYQSISYGVQEPFELKNQRWNLEAFQGAGHVSISLKHFNISGELWELRSKGISQKGYFRLIFPIPDYFKRPLSCLIGQPFNIGSSHRAAGYISMKYESHDVAFFDYEIAGASSLIFECYQQIDTSELWKITEAIRYAYGFISGSMIHNEVIRLEYEDARFQKVCGFEIKRLKDSNHSISPIKPDLLRAFRKHLGKSHKVTETHFSEKAFENLVLSCLKDVRLLRACKLLAESAEEHPFEIKASTYSVALETMKNIIIEANGDKINPFKHKKVARKTMAQFREIIERMDDEEFNNKKMVLGKLTQLNQVGNRDSFLLAFQLSGIPLNEDDKHCIGMRNDFLHGRIPYEGETADDDPRLIHIVFKLHFLVSCLILKYIGYSGPVLNQIKLTDLMYFKQKFPEPIFRDI